jgi:peptidoglycan biosynthesis protein MviN/MurJ (putative lipid II flippase)
MNTFKIVGKVATFFGAVSAIFTVILAIVTISLIQIVNSTATPPMNYVILSVLASVFPYLFLTVVSLVIAYVLRGDDKESVELKEDEEVPPTPVQSAEPVA